MARRLRIFSLSLIVFVVAGTVPGEEVGQPTSGERPLSERQKETAQAFDRLQELLVRLAELGGSAEPARAAVVRKAVRQAEEKGIALRMHRVAELLAAGRLAAALEEEEQLIGDLQALLELLVSEDRTRQLQNERERLQKLLERLQELARRQRDLRARSLREDQATDRLSREQSALAQETGSLAEGILESKNGQAAGGSSGSGSDPSAQGGSQRQEGGAGDRSPAAEEGQGSGPSAPAESSGERLADGEQSGASSSGSQGSGSSAAGSQGQGQNPPRDNAARSIRAAQQRMQEAARRLAEAQRQNAVREQEEALRELQAAEAQLAQILRQLRQEELTRMLTDLQTRLERMHQLQRQVYEETLKLANQGEGEDNRAQFLAVTRLQRQEGVIATEADQVIFLLQEEGSAAATLEAARQVRSDIGLVEDLFGKQDLGPLNQSTQQAILAALQEMLEAVRQRLEELDKAEAQQAGDWLAGRLPLVDLLAELRMIRTLQQRIRVRTEEYLGWLSGGTDSREGLRSALRSLADRQRRLEEITQELSSRLESGPTP